MKPSQISPYSAHEVLKVLHGGDIVVVNFKRDIRVNVPEQEKQILQTLLVRRGRKDRKGFYLPV